MSINQGLRDQIGEWKSSQAKQNEIYCVGNTKQLRFFKQERNIITVFYENNGVSNTSAELK